MNFASDNWTGAAPAIADALHEASTGYAAAYGASDIDKKLEQQFNAIFEREVSVFYVGTGTAANALAMSLVNRPGGVVFCHEEAHIIEDECGAVETMTGGARLCPVSGENGKMELAALENAIKRYPPDFVHAGQPMAISITQSTEAGTILTLDEIKALSEIAKQYGLPLHMDGARFANALVALNCSPAEMTWQSGIDLLSFGATKNGCWCAEAVVVFDPEKARQMAYLRKRAAHLFSKSRFIATQFNAYFENNLWLKLASHANQKATLLAKSFSDNAHIRLARSPDTNEVFGIMPKNLAQGLMDAGAHFYEWQRPKTGNIQIADNEALYRFVTSFATNDDDITDFTKSLQTLTEL